MLIDDTRYAWRRMRSKPATALGAITMLAVGVGLTTAMFTLADTLLLRPVPFDAADRLAQVSMMNERGGGRVAVSPAVFRSWRSTPSFAAVESAVAGNVVIESQAGAIERASATATRGLFEMLGVRPIRGRLFDTEEGRTGSNDRVLLSEDLWRTAFGSDPALVGRTIQIDGEPVAVVGILPADFRFPRWNTMVWRPVAYESDSMPRGAPLPVAFVRFTASMPQADALRLATDAAHQVDPATAKLYARPQSLAGLVLDRYYERAVPLLFGGVALVFLVLCANVGSLLLVRLSDRRREFSMCSALGASRGRLLRQAFLESAMLGVAGCVAGVGLAWLLVAFARGFLPEAFLLRTLNPLNLDLRALAAASAAGALAIVATGLLPAWLGTRFDAGESLKTDQRGGTETRGTRRLTRVLVIAEIALACTLLAGATLLVRSFVNLAGTDRGLRTDGVIVARISLPSPAFADDAARFAMVSTVEAEMRRFRGVQQAAFSFGLPPDGGWIYESEIRSDVEDAQPMTMVVEAYNVGADFFELYGIPIVRGRTFKPGDVETDVIIGERLAAQLWPGVDPIGHTFTYHRKEPPQRVIGIAREIHHPSMNPRLDRPEFYRPLQTADRNSPYFMISVRCAAACPDGAAIRQRLRSVSPAISVVGAGPIEAEYFEQLAAPRAAAALGFVFAATAIVAAAGGLFGVLSYAVGRRRREFGVRAALGASHQQIRGLVLRDGVRVAAAGIALGALSGWWLAQGLTSLQYGVTAADPVSWSIVIIVLVTTTLAATWRPASQAARVDPVALLKQE